MNYLWAGMIAVGILFGAFGGKMPEITNAALESAKDAVTLCITMMGVMSFWTGLMEIATRAGIIEMASKKMRPLIRFLFPQIPPGHKANACLLYTSRIFKLAQTGKSLEEIAEVCGISKEKVKQILE